MATSKKSPVQSKGDESTAISQTGSGSVTVNNYYRDPNPVTACCCKIGWFGRLHLCHFHAPVAPVVNKTNCNHQCTPGVTNVRNYTFGHQISLLALILGALVGAMVGWFLHDVLFVRIAGYISDGWSRLGLMAVFAALGSLLLVSLWGHSMEKS